ncbi:hypothetical protein ACFCYI_03870 [Streptomyces sp. NPDC056257]|uniref:hypothetical protein n=1 Tax=Streptomyces sp. NPDC056257 TaxID=3345765 RepID=UPI0035DB4B52
MTPSPVLRRTARRSCGSGPPRRAARTIPSTACCTPAVPPSGTGHSSAGAATGCGGGRRGRTSPDHRQHALLHPHAEVGEKYRIQLPYGDAGRAGVGIRGV